MGTEHHLLKQVRDFPCFESQQLRPAQGSRHVAGEVARTNFQPAQGARQRR